MIVVADADLKWKNSDPSFFLHILHSKSWESQRFQFNSSIFFPDDDSLGAIFRWNFLNDHIQMEDSENLNKIEIIVFDDDNRSLCKNSDFYKFKFPLYIASRYGSPRIGSMSSYFKYILPHRSFPRSHFRIQFIQMLWSSLLTTIINILFQNSDSSKFKCPLYIWSRDVWIPNNRIRSIYRAPRWSFIWTHLWIQFSKKS